MFWLLDDVNEANVGSSYGLMKPVIKKKYVFRFVFRSPFFQLSYKIRRKGIKLIFRLVRQNI